MTIALVQNWNNQNATGSDVTSVGSATTAGNFLVAHFAYRATAGLRTLVSVVDNGGNAWNTALVQDDSFGSLWMLYCANANPCSSITVTLSGACDKTIQLHEFSGLATSSVLHASASMLTDDVANYDAATVTTTVADCLVISFQTFPATGGRAWTKQSDGFTEWPQFQGTLMQCLGAYRILSGTGTNVGADWNLTSGAALEGGSITAAFLPAGGAEPVEFDLGVTSETDTAHPLGSSKSTLTGLFSETDSPNVQVFSKVTALGTGHTVDALSSLSVQKVFTLGYLHETDAVIRIAFPKAFALGLLHEQDTVRAPIVAKATLLDTLQVAGVLHSLTFAKPVTLGVLQESSALLLLTSFKADSLGIFHEQDALYHLILPGGSISTYKILYGADWVTTVGHGILVDGTWQPTADAVVIQE